MTEELTKILRVFLYCLLIGFVAGLCWTAVLVDRFIEEATFTVGEVRTAAHSVSNYTQVQIAALQSPKSQKAIQAGIEAAAALKGTIQLVNRQSIPRVNRTLDSLDSAITSLDRLTTDSNTAINQSLLPEAVNTLQSLQNSLQTVSETTETVGSDIHRITSDSSIPATLAELESTSRHVDEISNQLALAAQSAPTIMGSVDKIARTSAKYQKLLLLTQILAAIGRAIH